MLYRPRILFTAAFLWIALTGGRFLAPFLEHEANLSDDSAIGRFLAVQQLLSIPLSGASGSWADSLERQYPGRGRATILASAVASGGVVYLLHGLHRLSNNPMFTTESWYFVLRILFSVSSAAVFPVLDGMCLDFLEKDPHSDKEDYGKERLYGAISWAVANIVLALCLDQFGFVATYPLAVLATAFFMFAIYGYSNELARLLKLARSIQHRTSDCTEERKEVIDDESRSSQDSETVHNNQQVLSLRTLLKPVFTSLFGITFMFATFTLSSGQAVVESLVFLFFEFLGSSYFMMGITVLLTVAFEIPIFHIAPKLLERFGASLLLQAASACYIIRVFGYTFIPEGKIGYVLLLEPLHGITFACSVTATVEFVSQFMPEGYEATGQGFLYVVRGCGSVLGLLFGGWAEDHLGARTMYRCFAAVVSVGAICFFVGGAIGSGEARHRGHHHMLRQSEDGIEMGETKKGKPLD